MDEFNFEDFYDMDNLDLTTPNAQNDSDTDSRHESSRDSSPEPDRRETTNDRQLPLLRSSDMEPGKSYNRDRPTCIHYDFEWKIFQRGLGRKRTAAVDDGKKSDLVLAPADYWANNFQPYLESLLNDANKFSPESTYVCEKGKVAIRADGTRRGLKESFKEQEIPWTDIERRLESLGILFRARRMIITLTVELTYQETATTIAASTGTKQRKSTTNSQRAKLPDEAVFMTRVYQYHECKAKHCRQNSLYCLVDDKGNHVAIDNETMREIYHEIKKSVKEGESFGDVQNIEVPAAIRSRLLRNSKKRKANDDAGCRTCKSRGTIGGGCGEPLEIPGDPNERMQQFCTFNLVGVQSDRHRNGMEAANKFAMDELLHLDSVQKYPDAIKDAMIARGVPLGSALRFISDIPRFIDSLEDTSED